ncbi:hypothetical protein DE146DRAFT_361362 [Phaeosphaeria sp. MPI-PUGE-AT-0046c]|nr:hypothetical protein DE146DRAFT_361362 [Phaeosphaeria sp. MPI-PUGE-AT-0046c]
MYQFLNMIPLLLALTPVASADPIPTQESGIEKRKACDGESCVTYYADGGCTSGRTLGSYKPDCTGACFRYDSFTSIKVSGSAIWGVGCVAYSDTNCQNKIADSGNVRGSRCMTELGAAKSMQCYFRC